MGDQGVGGLGDLGLGGDADGVDLKAEVGGLLLVLGDGGDGVGLAGGIDDANGLGLRLELADQVQLGIQTGKMAAKVLTGEATCEDLPYETIEEYGIYINSDMLDAMGITLPDEIAAKAVEASEA